MRILINKQHHTIFYADPPHWIWIQRGKNTWISRNAGPFLFLVIIIMENREYVLTQDTGAIVERLLPNIGVSPDLDGAVDRYYDQLVETVGLVYPDLAITAFQERNIDSELSASVSDAMVETNSACICLDRYLLQGMESELSEGEFLRFEMTRTTEGQMSARQGCASVEKQAVFIAEQLDGRSAVLLDDGLFTGGTVRNAVRLLQDQGVEVTQVIGYVGNGATDAIQTELGIPVKVIREIPNLFEWIDIRDFGMFGGKQLGASKASSVTTAVPYLAPWSDGRGASFNMSGKFFEASKQMLLAQMQLITSLEEVRGSELTVNDLISAGFPLPTDSAKTIQISRSERVVSYLERCRSLVEREEKRNVTILDMDGTLYQLDGDENGFEGSALEDRVNQRAREFITDREPELRPDEVENVFQAGLSDDVGLSQHLSNRYGISREEYFDEVWDISPEGIVQDYEVAVAVVNELAETNDKLILLTAAPQAWQQRVLEYLGLEDSFESVYTGGEYQQKDEIFQVIAERYNGRLISVGDQQKTDIDPAIELGMETLLVNSPSDLKQLLSNLVEV